VDAVSVLFLLVSTLLNTSLPFVTCTESVEALFNLMRGYNIWFTGSNDEDDAFTDNIIQGIPLWQHIAIKLGGVILFTYFYILIT